jgi:hypothetical protein
MRGRCDNENQTGRLRIAVRIPGARRDLPEFL